jgi:hypothetical protein
MRKLKFIFLKVKDKDYPINIVLYQVGNLSWLKQKVEYGFFHNFFLRPFPPPRLLTHTALVQSNIQKMQKTHFYYLLPIL